MHSPRHKHAPFNSEDTHAMPSSSTSSEPLFKPSKRPSSRHSARGSSLGAQSSASTSTRNSQSLAARAPRIPHPPSRPLTPYTPPLRQQPLPSRRELREKSPVAIWAPSPPASCDSDSDASDAESASDPFAHSPAPHAFALNTPETSFDADTRPASSSSSVSAEPCGTVIHEAPHMDFHALFGTPAPPRKRRVHDDAQHLLALADRGERVPRRGEFGLSPQDIQRFEAAGYVMSGDRARAPRSASHERHNAILAARERELHVINDFRLYLDAHVSI